MSKEIRLIKRYQNRKLYDTHQSCYVTLPEIFQIIREGHDIRVIDNKTKNDITYITQIQILFDQEKKAERSDGTGLLKRVIKAEDCTFSGYIRKLETDKSSTESNGDDFIATDAFICSKNIEGNIETSTNIQ